MRLAACLLMVAGCAGMPTTTVPGPPDDDGDGATDAGIRPAPGAPVRNSFDGLWLSDGVIEPRQGIVGQNAILIEVREGRAVCVTEGATISCPLNWVRPSQARPITNNGLVLIEFTMDFPPCIYDDISAFSDEGLIQVSIVGSEIARTNGLVFDLQVFRQKYIFTDQTVLSKGTLEHFPDSRTNSCGFDSFE